MTERSVKHASFVIERTYDASPARVFAAFADPAIKRCWFAEGEGWEIEEFNADFRVAGSERSRFRFRGGELIRNDTIYQDIVPDQRIIITYSMMIGDNRISASLTTMEFKPAGSGTRLVFTEQGAFLDGYDDPAGREHGTGALLDNLGAMLKRESARA
jgi:uncharacterized protein YndB with AHSA1/START domain